MEILLVGFGGFLGAISRYVVYVLEKSVLASRFPIATFSINILGCFLAGVLVSIVEKGSPLSRQVILIGSIGFLGSFTTFSAFSVETLQLAKSGSVLAAVVNVTSNIVFGILAVYSGRILSMKFF